MSEILEIDVDGTTVRTLRAGSEKPPVVLLHGWPQTSHAWRHVIPLLAEGHTVLAPDLPGLGGSDPAPAGPGVRPAAGLLERWRERLGLGPVHLVGHDLGASVAFAWASAHPHSVESLTVVDAPLSGPGLRAFAAEAGLWHFGFFGVVGLAETLAAGREDVLLRPFLAPALAAGAMDETDLAHYVAAYAQPGRLSTSFGYYRGYPQDAEVFAAAPRLGVPVLAIGGSRAARWYPFRSYSEVASDVTGRVVEGSGHHVPEEKPEELAALVAQFVA